MTGGAVDTVLVLRALGLGDLVTGLPALRLLRDALPRHRIVLAAPSRWAALVRAAGTVDEVLDAVGKDGVTPLRHPPVGADLAVDLHGNGPASRRVLSVTRPRRLLAYADGEIGWRRDEHEIARWCRLVREGLGLAAPDPPLAGVLGEPPAAGRDGSVVVHCGAAAASRRWPAVRFASLVILLQGEGHRVLVTAGEAERDAAERIGAATGASVAVQPTLEELMGSIGRARLVVSGDTGVAHLAAAYGRPSVALFGPVSPRRWGPPAHPRHRVVWHGDESRPGDPHGTRIDPALLRITVGEVVAAAHDALGVDTVAGRVP